MSGIRRAGPYLVAALTGIVSGVYIFKPLVMKEAEKMSAILILLLQMLIETDTLLHIWCRNKAPNQANVAASESIPKSRDGPDDKATGR
ncbi:hypothetical protein CVT26_005371 [Gymnopilus dilepis]|uniref:Uncharacterized protein n=1 Tax=Gymnopilus dilepis TaxID=231916 RepID=A0A409YT51_9AGAR|nr:hypothetical protein CVT26_005371 [Gymnopilus dilepis]